MKIFILEDNEERIKIFMKVFHKHELSIAQDVRDAKEILRTKKEWDAIFLDHDLGGMIYVDSNEDNTGYKLALYIKENNIKYNELVIHSMNTIGAKNIQSVLSDGVIIPFINLFR